MRAGTDERQFSPFKDFLKLSIFSPFAVKHREDHIAWFIETGKIIWCDVYLCDCMSCRPKPIRNGAAADQRHFPFRTRTAVEDCYSHIAEAGSRKQEA
jgi:hypothetical protein